MKAIFINVFAAVVVGLVLSLIFWLALSGLLSFAALEWQSATSSPGGRLGWAILSLLGFAKAGVAAFDGKFR
jgi:hypothetical protein